MPGARKPAEQYGTSTRRPADFDRFWEALLAEAAAIPLNPTMVHLPLRSTDEVAVYAIGYDSLDGLRIAGWYCVPKESYLPPPYPALLIVPGYISEPTLPKSWAKLGYAAVGVAPRGKLRSNARYNPGYPGLLVDNIVDRQTYSYRGFYIDAARAVDFVLTRPEVDHARIGVHGSSQGGALTITTAALRPDVVTCGAAGAPYLCGFMDAASLTDSTRSARGRCAPRSTTSTASTSPRVSVARCSSTSASPTMSARRRPATPSTTRSPARRRSTPTRVARTTREPTGRWHTSRRSWRSIYARPTRPDGRRQPLAERRGALWGCGTARAWPALDLEDDDARPSGVLVRAR